MKSVKLYANAKINLFLDIESKKDNGYHNIKSLMQSIDLFDVVTVSYMPCESKVIEISVNVPNIPSNEKNIAYKAADRLVDKGHIKIDIEKNIPSPAGLAGGSADAAAVIYALKSFGCIEKNDAEIMKIAAGIGADVPFCLIGGSKKISGIGEIIEDISELPELNLVVSVSGEGVSTPIAYAMLDAKFNDFSDHKVKDFDFNCFDINSIYNIFEDVVLNERPEAKSLKEKMINFGAKAALMSGSGPAIVGIFETSDAAIKAAEELKLGGAVAYACKTVSCGIKTI